MQRSDQTASKVCNIYIDESSQTKHRYLVLGGLIVPIDVVEKLQASLLGAKLPELPQGELKWTKVSRTKLKAYQRVVEVVLSNSFVKMGVQFHCLVVDTTKIKDAIYNQGSRDVGFNKEIYQLCMKFLRLHSGKLLHVYLDRRETPNPLEELRAILNFGARKKGISNEWPFRRLHFRDSKDCIIMQTADVILGSLAFQLNNHHLATGASISKIELSQNILAMAGITNVFCDTPAAGTFTIWHRQLK